MKKKQTKKINLANKKFPRRTVGEIDAMVNLLIKKIKQADAKERPKALKSLKDKNHLIRQSKKHNNTIKSICRQFIKDLSIGKKTSAPNAKQILTKARNELKKVEHDNSFFEMQVLDLKKTLRSNKEQVDKVIEYMKINKDKSFKSFSELYLSLPRSLRFKLKNLNYRHPAFEYLVLPSTIASQMRDEYAKAESHKHKNAIKLNVDQIIRTAEVIIESEKSGYFELVCALCAATGRRPVEIQKTGTLEMSDKSDHLIFYGQAKIRGTRDDTPREIPILCSSPQRIILALNKIRSIKDLSSKSNTLVNHSYSSRLNATLRRKFGLNNIDLRCLRIVYAKAIEKYFYEKTHLGTMSSAYYLAHCLGHSPNDQATQVRYVKIHPIFDFDAKPYDASAVEEVKKQEVCQKIVERIESRRQAIYKLAQRGNPFESLVNYVVENLKVGKWVTKTDMERPEGTPIRSRAIVNKFVEAVGLKTNEGEVGWPKKPEDFIEGVYVM